MSSIPGEDTVDFDMATKASGGTVGIAHLGIRGAFVAVPQGYPAGEVWAGQAGFFMAADASTQVLDRQ